MSRAIVLVLDSFGIGSAPTLISLVMKALILLGILRNTGISTDNPAVT